MTILRDLLIASIHEGRQSMGYDKCLGLLTVRHLDGHAEEADAILLTPSCQALQQRLDALDAAEAEMDRFYDFVNGLDPAMVDAYLFTENNRARGHIPAYRSALDAAEAREKVLREALRDLADFVDAKHPTNPTALYLTQKARAALAATGRE